MATFPTNAITFPARVDGQTIFSQHINVLQDEVMALESSILGPGTLPTPQIIAGASPPGVVPSLVLDSGVTAKGRLFAILSAAQSQNYLSQNLAFDGTNWLADDITQPSVALCAINQDVVMSTAPAGANPKTPGVVFSFLSTGALRERARSVNLGEMFAVPFNAANFTAATGTWTPTAPNTQWVYSLVGTTCFMNIYISSSATSAATATLRIALPAAVTPKSTSSWVGVINHSAAWAPTYVALVANSTQMLIYPAMSATGTVPISATVHFRLELRYEIV